MKIIFCLCEDSYFASCFFSSELSPSSVYWVSLVGYNLSSSAPLHPVNPTHPAEAQQEFESREADLELAAEKKVFVFNSTFYQNPPYYCLITLEIEIDPGVLIIIADITLFLFFCEAFRKMIKS